MKTKVKKSNPKLYKDLNERRPTFEKKLSYWVLYAMRVLAITATLVLLLDFDEPKCYTFLFLLPLSFTVVLFAFSGLFKNMLDNLGVLIITALFFCRLVISPLFMALGSYAVTITRNIETNTTYAILLMVYECLAVFGLLFILDKKKIVIPEWVKGQGEKPVSSPKYTFALLCCVYVFLWCVSQVPQVLTAMRTILDIRDPYFTHFEDAHIAAEQGTTFLRKLAAVSGTYLLRVLTLIIPAHLIILLAKKKNVVTICISFALCLFPLFLIGGTIARTLLYVLFLFFLTNYVFQFKHWKRKFILLLGVGGVAVILFWILRDNGANFFESFSKRFSAYFSGANVVSGVFNLPDNADYKWYYFLRDITGSIPFGGTFFNLYGDGVGAFFNKFNQSSGQIPPTIGMGYYYFGPVLAPAYSLLFAFLVFKAGNALNRPHQKRPFQYIILLYILFYGSMGIVMYNIEITISNFFSVLLPICILEWITYGDLAKIPKGFSKWKNKRKKGAKK